MSTRSCRACTLPMIQLNAEGHNILACPRCDTSTTDGTVRLGPPNMPNTVNGTFRKTWGDK